MGVSGSGKTTIGQELATYLHWPFFDADDYHPRRNIEKMASGMPLSDADRTPWLWVLHDLMHAYAAPMNGVLACSALKQAYREILAVGPAVVRFVYLQVDADLLHTRVIHRSNHYMPPDLLASQLAIFESPNEAIVVSATSDPQAIVAAIVRELGLGADHARGK